MTAVPAPALQPREIRRPLTTAFIDLVGSTALSVVLDDDVYSGVITDYRHLVSAAADLYGGTVEHDEGDGRMVWFGWPLAHRDDADRAVSMALDLFDRLGPVAERVRALSGRELTLRIGIHTGPQLVRVTSGREGADILGGSANFAAKVQQRCDPGMLLISEATVDALTRPFELVPHGVLTVDALPGGIQVYGVTGPAEPPAVAGSLVGRELELAVLRERWDQAATGLGSAVLISAGAGLGKSRLCRELVARCDAPLLVQAEGDERRAEHPLHALVDALARAGLLLPGAPPETADEVRAIVAAAAEGGPTMMVVDDAQWLDASSGDVLAQLADAPPANLLLVVASRPGSMSIRWPEHTDQLRLGPLTRDAAAALVADAVGSGAVDDTTRDMIVERGGGNPLFLRWLARTSSDTDFEGVRRILRPRSGVPVVLQQVLRSVLDGTGVDEETTSMAAAIGTEFDATLLAAVLDRPQASVDDDLRRLVASEVIQRADAGARRYRFSHALLRDLAYDLLVHDDQIRRHARIADTLETDQSPDDALIGYHHDHAGRHEQAARAKLRAARTCRARGAYREGAALTARAIELLAALDATEVELRLEASELQHLFATVVDPAGYTAGIRASAELLDVLPTGDRERTACMDKTSQWAAASMTGNLRVSAGLLYEIYRIGPVHYPAIVPYNQCARGYHAGVRGRYAHAETLLRRSTSQMLEVGIDPWMAEHWPAPDDPIALGLAFLPTVLLQRGHMRSGLDWLRRSWQRAESLENGAHSMAHISMNTAMFWAALGDGFAVVEHSRDMTKLGTELEAELWVTLGGVYGQMGVALAEPSLEHATALGGLANMFEAFSGSLASVLYLYAAQSALGAGELDVTRSCLDGVDRLSTSHGIQQFDAEAARLRAATETEPNRAGALAAAVGLARRQGARRYHLRALADLTELDPQASTGEGPAAAALRSALAQFPEPLGDPDAARVERIVTATSP